MPLPKPLHAQEIIAKLTADEREWQQRASDTQGRAAHAYARLIDIALKSDTGQAKRVAHFLAATYNGHAYTFDLFNLRALDVPISDDMLTSLDALRWGMTDLYNLVPEGDAKIRDVLTTWGIKPKSAD